MRFVFEVSGVFFSSASLMFVESHCGGNLLDISSCLRLRLTSVRKIFLALAWHGCVFVIVDSFLVSEITR